MSSISMFLRIIILLLFSLFAIGSLADDHLRSDLHLSSTSFGGVGLIENPTARFSSDGEFGFGVSKQDPYRRMFARIQFFPWLEGTVKYTEDTAQPYNKGSKQTLKDKGIDLKIKLFNETEIFPALAVGLTDFGGTGRFGGEFLVASKSIGNIDYTLGLGWGKYNGLDHLSNPLGYFCERCKTRGGYFSLGGKINLGRLFSGEGASFFGGLQYKTPIPNLSLKLEYDSTNYSEPLGRLLHINRPNEFFELDSRINFGLDYKYRYSDRDNIAVQLGFVRGNTIYANIVVHSNLNIDGKDKFIAPKEILNKPTIKSFYNLKPGYQKYLTDLIISQMRNVGFATHSIAYNQDEVIVEISQGRFLDPTEAIDLAARILGNNSPKNIQSFTIVNVDQGLETLRATVKRDSFTESVAKGPVDPLLIEYKMPERLSEQSMIFQNTDLYPNFSWFIKPRATGTLQHQRKFYFWQLEAHLHAEYSFNRNLTFSTDIGLDIANNFDEYNFHIPDGKLYHVRQDRRLYLTQGESGIRRLAVDYTLDLTPELKGKFSAGLLEWMYGGIGGEILYMPSQKNWALGIDAFWVKQRDFDQRFSFKDYEVTTGFLSFYYDIPFYDMRLKLSGGKFLAKDVGFLIDLSRRFDSGARVGGMVALTDCDAACVGEGSFNKWIYFELPMDLFSVRSSTKAKSSYYWTPLTKDAGQKVEAGGGLYRVLSYAKDEVDSERRTPWSINKILSGFGTKPKDKF